MSGTGYSQGQSDASQNKPKDDGLWKKDYAERQNYEKGYQSAQPPKK